VLVLGLALAALLGEAAGPREVTAQEELFVADSASDSITVYTRTASGNAVPIRTLVGPSTGLNVPVAVVVDRVNDELFVSNAGGTVTVYRQTAAGDTAPIRTLAGPATGLAIPEGLVVDTVNNELLVANFNANTITIHSRTASGNAAPLRTVSGFLAGFTGPIGLALDLVHDELVIVSSANDRIVTVLRSDLNLARRIITGPATGLNSPFAVAVDTANDEIVVSNLHGHSVTVYRREAAGNAAPLRTLAGPATGLLHPVGVVVDTASNELVVGGYDDALTVYPRTANGNTAPLRTLSGGATGLSAPFFVAVTHDFGRDELFVDSLQSVINVYDRTASGSPSPIRTLQGPATQLGVIDAIVVDTVNDELVVLGFGEVNTFSRTAAGNTAPLRTLRGVGFEMSGSPAGLAVDVVNNEYVIAYTPGDSIQVYDRTANGTVDHVRKIVGPATGLDFPRRVFVDPVHDELFVPNLNANSVTVYSRTASGNTPPIRTLVGAATGLHQPLALTVDLLHDELIVGNLMGNTVTVYPRAANGNVAPIRTLSGDVTGLVKPSDVVVDTVNDELVVVNFGFPDGSVNVFERTANGNASPIRTFPTAPPGASFAESIAVTTQECVPGTQSVDLTTTGPGGPSGVGAGVAAVTTNPVTLAYSVQACANHEMFLIVLAPGAAVYYNGSALAALPDPLSSMTPFVTGGPLTSNGTHTLFSGSLPPGSYDFFLICDRANNGHLDLTSPPLCLNGAFDHLPLTVQP
jgi:hypothetical protein